MTTLGVVGVAATGYTKEAEDAAREGRDFSAWEAGKKAVKEVAVAPFEAIYETARQNATEERAAAEPGFLGQGAAAAKALARTAWQVPSEMIASGYGMSKQILAEEHLRAVQDGSGWSFPTLSAAARVFGELTMGARIAEALVFDADPHRREGEMERRLKDYARARM